ncbi:MAG: glycosyltransferase family 4 protein [Candidatus Bathyarchaeia archaeon]
MKICLLSYSDGRLGGYAAAYRLHKGLVELGVDSQMVVANSIRDDTSVIAPQSEKAKVLGKMLSILNYLPLKFYPRRHKSSYSLNWIPDNLPKKIADLNPSVINLHWVAGGFLQIETLAKFGKPIVWTLHDMWPFTGGCHYSQGCERYTASCGACPQLESKSNWDLSRWVWHRKAKAWKNLNLTIVTPSSWLANCAKASSLFGKLPIHVIPNGLDLEKFRPIAQPTARNLLNLPADKHLILFGATDAIREPRKGFDLLQQSLQLLSNFGPKNIELVIFGSSKPNESPNFGFNCHFLGTLNDDLSLVLAYSAADVFVAPSREDNLPNTVIESLACGRPCVAFNIGGMPDMISHKNNGYLAKPFEVEDLARGIDWVLGEQERLVKLKENARSKAEKEFSQELQARRYLSLFTELVK